MPLASKVFICRGNELWLVECVTALLCPVLNMLTTLLRVKYMFALLHEALPVPLSHTCGMEFAGEEGAQKAPEQHLPGLQCKQARFGCGGKL